MARTNHRERPHHHVKAMRNGLVGACVAAVVFSFGSANAEAGGDSASIDRRLELGLQPQFASFRWGEETEEPGSAHGGGSLAVDARYYVLPAVAVGLLGGTTLGASGRAKNVEFGVAQGWLEFPGRVFRPWIGLGVGVIGSSVVTTPAISFGIGIDWCAADYAEEDRSCGLTIGGPILDVISSTSNQYLHVITFGPRLAFRF